MRIARITQIFIPLLFLALYAFGQSPNGSINGLVLDPTNHLIVGAEVIAVNDVTGVQYTTKTNNAGVYVLPSLPPGPYRLQVSNIGFKTIIKPDIVLSVQDALSINFTLPVGAVMETVTIEGGAPLVNTESAGVSTVVGHKYVENMPLNGRSFQSLILLTPGVVTTTPQQGQSASNGNNGEFSVNGQRTESNYYMVDGVSANLGISPGLLGPGTSASVAASTALGTTQALVSVDALQEFRVQSSSYSAEYGRNPGGQFSFVTRSGTDEWHGTAFEYVRNNLFDANNWFNGFLGQAKPALRQNDFGGTLGGPAPIPRFNHGQNRTFFFLSYEGLRLVQPQAAMPNYVPDLALRQSAPASLEPIVNAFPLPNGRELGNGLAEFVSTWSNPNSLNAYSFRVDHNLHDRLRLFFRFSDADSNTVSRGTQASGSVPSLLQSVDYVMRTYTLGATSLVSNHLSNDFRLNYSSNAVHRRNRIDNFGGATQVSLAGLQQIDSAADSYALTVGLLFGSDAAELNEQSTLAIQRQWNLADSLTFARGKHQLKLGFDYRRLTPVLQSGPNLFYFFFNQNEFTANSPSVAEAFNLVNVYPLYENISAFVQDEWNPRQRLSLSLGLRWDVNPATGVTQGRLPYTVRGAENLSTMTLAPQGTPLWQTAWYNFAPRLGAAYILRNRPNFETVLRAGAGLFFDTGQQSGSFGFEGPGFQASTLLGTLFGLPVSFPLPAAQAFPQITQNPVPPYPAMYVYPAHLQLPYTIQWNVTGEQALGKSQALSLAYVGSHAARLLEQRQLNAHPFNPNFTTVNFFQNGLTADYNALQLQFQRRLSGGLTGLAAYTWSHSIDYGSTSLTYPYVRGNSDFDVRQNFSAAVSYDLPSFAAGHILRALVSQWGIDDRFSARSGFPVTLRGFSSTDPTSGQLFYSGLNLVPGTPVYLYGRQYPGGRAINPAAFALPSSRQTGDAPRNFLRGFGVWQMDLAIRREFVLHDRLKLQFRAEAFNIFNHPNFGLINASFGQPSFGQAVATLNTSLGVLSPLYQMGGPRSMQFACKLVF